MGTLCGCRSSNCGSRRSSKVVCSKESWKISIFASKVEDAYGASKKWKGYPSVPWTLLPSPCPLCPRKKSRSWDRSFPRSSLHYASWSHPLFLESSGHLLICASIRHNIDLKPSHWRASLAFKPPFLAFEPY